MSSILSLVKALYPFNYSITGQGNDDAIEVFKQQLPFDVFSYQSGQQLNGWHIPHAWSVTQATIHLDEKLIYDAELSPLGVAVLSPSFSGKLALNELKQHLVSNENLPTAIPYQWQNLYRPNELTWKICMPHHLVEALDEGNYQVKLSTTMTPSSMKVLSYTLPGESDETIIINGHNCHPYQANDDISGCAVAIEVIQALKARKYRHYSYQVMIAPELHGPMFWLNEQSSTRVEKLKAAILLKSVGNDAPLRLQHSFTGTENIDIAAINALNVQQQQSIECGGFREIYGNDETVFEAPPYNIPTISLTRWPFKQYHSDLDTPETLSESALQDSLNATLAIIDEMEQSAELQQVYKRNTDGLVCLSHFNLYKSIPAVSDDGVDYDSTQGRWNLLMNRLPRELDNNVTVYQLAHKYQLPAQEIKHYLEQWLEQGLLIKE